jgi:hypothetical protein
MVMRQEVVVRLGHRLGGPVLVDGADVELLEVAAVGVRPGGLARRLVGLDRGRAGRVGHASLPWSCLGAGVNHDDAAEAVRRAPIDSAVN